MQPQSLPQMPFPITHAPGHRPQESGGLLINSYASAISGSPPKGVLWDRTPGMRRMTTVDEVQVPGWMEDEINTRGLTVSGNVAIQVVNEACYTVNLVSTPSMIATRRGDLPGSNPVTIVKNNAEPVPDIFAVADGVAWLLFTDATPATYDGGGNVGSPYSLAMIDGFAIFGQQNGRMISTKVNSTTMEGTDTREISKPDLVKLINHNDELVAFGSDYFRVYRNVGDETFPLEYVQGSEQDIGIIGRWAATGNEPGFSAKTVFIGSDGVTYRLEGYNPVPVSTPEIQRFMTVNSPDPSLIQAYSYLTHGRQFATFTCPGHWTLELDLQSYEWHARDSFQRTDHRARQITRHNSVQYVGDDTSARLYRIEQDWPKEDNDPLTFVVQSAPIKDYPQGFEMARHYYDFTPASGTLLGDIPIETDPKVRILISLDGGSTFSYAVTRSLGKVGETLNSIMCSGSGLATAQGMVVRLEVTDTGHLGFMGGTFEPVPLAA